MRERTAGAVLYPFRRMAEVTAAVPSQAVKRAIAAQAVKAVRRRPLVTWKEFAAPVLKKRKGSSSPVFAFFRMLHDNSPLTYINKCLNKPIKEI